MDYRVIDNHYQYLIDIYISFLAIFICRKTALFTAFFESPDLAFAPLTFSITLS